MQSGGFVEIATRQQLLENTVQHAYTRTLMDGSRGYVAEPRKRDAATGSPLVPLA
jgi:ABC-type dipeptide/oligopeptide/nickel transport system ATPase subunit